MIIPLLQLRVEQQQNDKAITTPKLKQCIMGENIFTQPLRDWPMICA